MSLGDGGDASFGFHGGFLVRHVGLALENSVKVRSVSLCLAAHANHSIPDCKDGKHRTQADGGSDDSYRCDGENFHGKDGGANIWCAALAGGSVGGSPVVPRWQRLAK